MTSRLTTSGAAGSAGIPSLTLSGVALNAGRIALLLGALFMLAFIRGGVPIYIYAGAAGISLAAVWMTVRESADLKIWAFYLVGFVVFAQLRTLADETGIATQFAYVADAEEILFFGQAPTVWLQSHFYSVGRVGPLELAAIMVYITYFVFPHLVVFAAWRFDRKNFPVYVAGVVGTVYCGLLVSVLVPTAPPWLAGQSGELPHVFRVMKDVANEVTPSTYQAAYDVVGPNDVAAMPSLHTAIPAAIAMITWSRARRPLAIAALLYVAAMGFSLVYLGEHYVLDVLAGIATAAIVVAVVTAYFRRREAADGPAEGDSDGARYCPAQTASDTAVHSRGEQQGAQD